MVILFLNRIKKCLLLTREECEKRVKGYSKAVYKKFETRIDAVAFILNKSPNRDQQILNKDSPKLKNPGFFLLRKRKLNK